jgi:multicomponent K+:H+ antiporter subunit D
MSTALLVMPFVLPALTACAAIALGGRLALQRALSIASTALQLGVAVALAVLVDDGVPRVLAFGAWPAFVGIVFVVDRLAATMLLMTTGIGVLALLHAVRGVDARGAHFHALFQFQLAGLCGAFLTGDLFNLFVCFELMLIASYALLQHGGGATRLRAGVHYVVLNLFGSALFLVAVSVIYRIGGTLNMADLAQALARTPAADVPWLQAASLLLLVVFLLKAAAAPLHLWLAGTYTAAVAPVAALFAVLTKVGAYAVLRVGSVVFGDSPAIGVIQAVVLPAGLATIVVAAVGALAASRLATLAAWLALGSSGTWLAGVGLFDGAATGGALFYVVPSTAAIAALFLLADAMAQARGEVADTLCGAPRMHGAGRFGALFLVLAVTIAGLPPLAGFIGKTLLLQGAGPGAAVLWAVLLGSSLVNVVALARAGSRLFWAADHDTPCPGLAAAAHWRVLAPAAALTVTIVAITPAAGPVQRYARAAADAATAPRAYVDAVTGSGAARSPVGEALSARDAGAMPLAGAITASRPIALHSDAPTPR